ncbi:hypothetical protein JMM81_19370 [Bacillus sp. V3B]|uniref:hypothetical protein n=1 Tax=Bacillus sp. V3B TaxID=2804915 RepID=UPI00210CA255|nr:hypothetical protein [Bacillus sp. V3B]MCQ6277040.1 hypothetical protein [Bacillus sp. V3B]
MTHYSYEEWMKYVKNELGQEIQEMYENHLYSCDQCLDLYLQAVTEVESELPFITDDTQFTDVVMTQVSEVQLSSVKSVKEKRSEKKRFYQSAVFHYTIAAAMTILLMTTGVFQSLTQYAENIQSPNFQKKETSMTAGFVDKTFAWMDLLEEKNKKEEK